MASHLRTELVVDALEMATPRKRVKTNAYEYPCHCGTVAETICSGWVPMTEDRASQQGAERRSAGVLTSPSATRSGILGGWVVGVALALESSLACVLAALLFSKNNVIPPLIVLILAVCSLIAAFLLMFRRVHRTPVGTVLVWLAAASNVGIATWLVVAPITTRPHSAAYFAFAWVLAAVASAISAGLVREIRPPTRVGNVPA
jgi:hypothetical protein